ncbi:MAG: hypothetical protein AB8H86_18360 [Polyangiales bacterium]
MRPLLFLPLLFCACLPTGTGNPLQDAAPSIDGGAASDAGGGFDASASDSGPSSDGGVQLPDSGPSQDASPGDAGFDASCPDAGPTGCGVTGGPSCDCLAGEELALGSGRPLALVDHPALDGRMTLVRQRADVTRDVLEALVVDTEDGSTASTFLFATQVVRAAAAADPPRVSIAYVSDGAESELQLLDSAIMMGADEPVEQSYVHSHPIGELAVARAGTMSVSAFVSASSDEPSEGQSVFVHRVVDGVADPGVSQYGAASELRAIAITAAPAGWLLSYATDAAVFAQLLDASGAAVGIAQEITTASFVSELHLVARDEGFFLAVDGATPAVHFLDDTGASSSDVRVEGRIVALEWASAGHAMTVRSEAVLCSSSASPLIFERITPDLMSLHDPVRVGAGELAAVVLVDEVPWVASSAGSALTVVNACVAD